MQHDLVLARTAKGETEIESRATGLERNLRYVLILVDGKSSVQGILEKGAGLPDVEAGLEQLLERGFVARAGDRSGAPGDIKSELIAIARELLGDEAEKVVKKLEAAPDSREGLREVVQGCKKLVRLVIDEKKADQLAERCAAVLDRL